MSIRRTIGKMLDSSGRIEFGGSTAPSFEEVDAFKPGNPEDLALSIVAAGGDPERSIGYNLSAMCEQYEGRRNP